jgi:hypothetical protein
MPGQDGFLLTLEACEKTSADLLRALESGTSDAVALAARRDEQVERLSAILPAELRAGELERLKALFNVGQEARLRTLASKVSATRNLVSLRCALHVARQLAATRNPRPPGVDCTG